MSIAFFAYESIGMPWQPFIVMSTGYSIIIVASLVYIIHLLIAGLSINIRKSVRARSSSALQRARIPFRGGCVVAAICVVYGLSTVSIVGAVVATDRFRFAALHLAVQGVTALAICSLSIYSFARFISIVSSALTSYSALGGRTFSQSTKQLRAVKTRLVRLFCLYTCAGLPISALAIAIGAQGMVSPRFHTMSEHYEYNHRHNLTPSDALLYTPIFFGVFCLVYSWTSLRHLRWGRQWVPSFLVSSVPSQEHHRLALRKSSPRNRTTQKTGLSAEQSPRVESEDQAVNTQSKRNNSHVNGLSSRDTYRHDTEQHSRQELIRASLAGTSDAGWQNVSTCNSVETPRSRDHKSMVWLSTEHREAMRMDKQSHVQIAEAHRLRYV